MKVPGTSDGRLDMKALSRISAYGIKRGIKGDVVWLVIGIVSWLFLREKVKLLRPIWRGKVKAGERIELTVVSSHARN